MGKDFIYTRVFLLCVLVGSWTRCGMLLNSFGRISYTKRLGLQWEAHVAPHSTCASRCSLGKVDSLPWASSRGQEILVFCYGCGIGGSNLLRKSYWDCSGKHMSPRIRHVLPAAVWGRLIRWHGHFLGVIWMATVLEKRFWGCSGKHMSPHIQHMLPTALLRFSKLCPMSTDTVEGVSVPDATTVIPQHNP